MITYLSSKFEMKDLGEAEERFRLIRLMVRFSYISFIELIIHEEV